MVWFLRKRIVAKGRNAMFGNVVWSGITLSSGGLLADGDVFLASDASTSNPDLAFGGIAASSNADQALGGTAA